MAVRGTNSQTDANGDLVEAVVTVSKEQLARFPVKTRLPDEGGKQSWMVTLVSSGEVPLVIKGTRPKRHAGDQKYLNE